MKLVSKLAVLTFAALLISGVALAGTAEKTTTHQMTGTVVSVDTKANTVTFKDDKGQEHTAPCMGNAVKELSTVKAGEKITCTCKDNAKGEHLGVTSIKAAK